MAGAAFKVPTIFTAIDKVTRVTKIMTKGVVGFARKAEAAFARVDRRIARMGRSLKNTMGTFGLFIGLTAGLAVLGGAVTIIADYEQANANLAAVLGINVDQTLALQKASQKLGATTAFTASEVAGLQTEFARLGFTQKEILGATQATLALASATKTELPQAAVQVGAAIRAFGLEATAAGRVADVFAKSTSLSALNMTKLDVAMSKVAPVAKQFGFSIEDTVALMGKLADAGFDASTMATATRSVILNLADSNGKLAKALGGPARTLPEITKAMVKMREKGIDLADMLELTDKRSVAAFATFLEGAEGIDDLAESLFNAGGAAQEMADKQLNTLTGRMTILKSAYSGFILSMDTGNGTFSQTAKKMLEVTTEVFSLASGFQRSREDLASLTAEQRINLDANIASAKKLIFVLKLIKRLVIAYVAFKVALIAYNVGLGISTSLLGKNIMALRGNSKAIKVHTFVTKAATVVTRIFNFVLSQNPIALVIIAVAALTTGIVLLTKHIKSQTREFRLNSEIQKRVFTNTAKQRVETIILFKTLRQLNIGSERHNEILAELETMQPGIIEKFNLRSVALGRIDKAEQSLTESILKRAKAEAISQLIREKTVKLVEAQLAGPTGTEKFRGFFGAATLGAAGGAGAIRQQRIQGLNEDINATVKLFEDLKIKEAQEATVDPANIDATKETIATERSEKVTEGRLKIDINSPDNVDIDDSEIGAIPIEFTPTHIFGDRALRQPA